VHGPRPTATYRFQLTPTFGFADAAAQLPRLARLGISHVYLSPVAEAVPGSTHGYDVTDHTRVRDELGGLAGLTALLETLVERGMGALVDHVPNHVAVAQAELNPQWWAMLRDGPDSKAARWFDVDWAAADGHVILPVLGQPLDEVIGELELVGDELRLGTQRFPLAPGTESFASAADALARQHYRLQWWRDPARNVRRFFTIDGLVGVRVVDPDVVAVVDTVPRLLADHEAFAGVRVDHIDGLVDPLAYLDQLREAIGDRWLVVEKILAADETLPGAWPVEGTTGYEHAAVLEHAFLDRQGWERLRTGWARAVEDGRPFRAWELDARREVLRLGLRPDLERVGRAAAAALGVPADDELLAAVETLSVHLARYRTYLPDHEGRPALEAALAAALEDRPEQAIKLARLAAALEEPGEWRDRWQQLTGPAMAKGVEDRAFWRYLPLASLAEVGGRVEPDPTTDAVAAAHAHHAATATSWPRTLLAGTTHDVAHSEDVRAAGLALAASPDAWDAVVDAWRNGPGALLDIDPATQWLALQTVATTADLDATRLRDFLVKAAREADLHTSWTAPAERYELALGRLAGVLATWDPVCDLARDLHRRGRAISLAMLVARLTAPGVADVYQGTEAFRDLLVDPDNRVPPDHAALDVLVERAATMDGRAAWGQPDEPAEARAVALARLLPLVDPADGYAVLAASAELLAFTRTSAAGSSRLVTVVPRAVDRPDGLVVDLPPGRWHHVLVDDLPDAVDRLAVDDALAAFPAIVLVSR
jgi:(1->4)-alpha-D-glucan 1-alpha-D-glucosylmutase